MCALAYVFQGDLYAVWPGRRPIRLTRGAGVSSPRWSPDGRWISYRTGSQLWLVSADGRRLVRLETDRLPAGEAKWAPWRPLLAYVKTGSLWVVKVGRQGPSEPRELHMPAADFAWAPDGAALAVEEPWQGPWVGERVPDPEHPPQGGVVVVSLGGGPARDLFRIPWADLPPEHRRPLYPLKNLAWSPDGRWLTFHALPTFSSSLAADETSLMIVPSAGGAKPQKLASMLAYPDWVGWSPDGQTLAYIGGTGRSAWTGKRLVLARPPSFAPETLTPEGFNDQGFAWAPACSAARVGARLAVVRSGPGSPVSRYDRPLPAIWLNGQQVTRPEPPYGHYGPHLDCAGRLYWIAVSHERAVVMGPSGPLAVVDVPDWYYDHWSIGQVLHWRN